MAEMGRTESSMAIVVFLVGLGAGVLVDLYAARVRRMLSAGRAGTTSATAAITATSAAMTALATGALAAMAWRWSPHPWSAALLVPLLVLVTVVDIEHQLILDGSVLTGLVTGLALSVAGLSVSVPSAIFGLILGSAIMVVVAMASPGSMGGGDVKFSAVMGAFLGPGFGLLALFVGFILAALAGLALLITRRKGRKDSIPFGPFLAGGTYIAAVWGPVILSQYLSLLLKK